MEPVGYFNDRGALYLRSGVKYNIVLDTDYEGVPRYEIVRLSLVSQAQNSEEIVSAYLCNEGFTVTLNESGILTYEKTGEGAVIYNWITDSGKYGCFLDKSSVKKLVIGEGVRELSDNTFYNYPNLEEAALPKSLESIGSRAFSTCTKLAAVTFPEESRLQIVKEEAFLSTPFLNDATGNYKMLGTVVLKYLGQEKETMIPQEATAIAGSAMQGSETLEKITILDKVKRIGDFGMAQCTKLPDIHVPGNVTDIAYCAFYQNTALESAVLEEGVESIGEEAFFGCDKLKEIYIPKSVKYIGMHAIGYATYNWNSYQYNLSEELPKIYCYYNTSGYHYAKRNQIPYDLLDEKDLGNEQACWISSGYAHVWPLRLSSLVVKFAGETLKEGVDYSVIYQDSGDKTKSTAVITGIGSYFGVRKIELSLHPQNNGGHSQGNTDSGAVITDLDSKISYKVKKTDQKNPEAEVSRVPSGANGTVKIPDTVKLNGQTYKVTGIGANAFANNTQLKIVEIENSVKTIGDNAFFKCTSLKKVVIGKNVTKIGKKAFGSCKKLRTIKIKTTKLTKKSIGKGAFSGTSSKVKVTVPKKKAKAYKTMLRSKGISKKAKIK